MAVGVVKAMAQAAADMVRQKWSADASETTAKHYLSATLSAMGPGLPAKAAQIMGSCSDTEFGAGIAVKERAILGGEEVKDLIARFAPKLSADLAELAERGISGSLGQVHRATLRDGRSVAVKVQYPDMAEAIERQLETMFRGIGIFACLGLKVGGMERYRPFLGEKLAVELDYRQELSVVTRFAEFYRDTREVRVPGAIEEYSNERILVQDWLDHAPLVLAKNFHSAQRSEIASCLLRTFLEQALVFGEIHGDLHAGNIGLALRPDNGIVLYDFGSTIKIDAHPQAALTYYLAAMVHGSSIDAKAFFVDLGFDAAMLTNLGDRLNEVYQIFSEPFRTSSFCVNDWDLGGPSGRGFRPGEDAVSLSRAPLVLHDDADSFGIFEMPLFYRGG
jgi:ABC1 atypical kinase-like domain